MSKNRHAYILDDEYVEGMSQHSTADDRDRYGRKEVGNRSGTTDPSIIPTIK